MGKCSCMAISIKLQKTNSPKIKMPLGDKGEGCLAASRQLLSHGCQGASSNLGAPRWHDGHLPRWHDGQLSAPRSHAIVPHTIMQMSVEVVV